MRDNSKMSAAKRQTSEAACVHEANICDRKGGRVHVKKKKRQEFRQYTMTIVEKVKRNNTPPPTAKRENIIG